MHAFFAHPIVRGAMSGLLTAAAVDFAAFRKWASFKEAAEYSWALAAWRWFQGAAYGAITAAGYGALIG